MNTTTEATAGEISSTNKNSFHANKASGKFTSMKHLWLTAWADIVESLRARWFMVYAGIFGSIVILLFVFGRYSPLKFFGHMFSAMATAFSTASSAAARRHRKGTVGHWRQLRPCYNVRCRPVPWRRYQGHEMPRQGVCGNIEEQGRGP